MNSIKMTRKLIKIFSACGFSLVFILGITVTKLSAQGVDSHIPDLAGIWDGTPRSRPVNRANIPWGEENFPDLNERAKAYQEVWEEIVAPKYDCQPASSPAIQYDPYHMQVTQWPDRVLFRYEKDDQLRTVWLDGRQPDSLDFSLQGFSRGYYEDGSEVTLKQLAEQLGIARSTIGEHLKRAESEVVKRAVNDFS